MPNWRVRLHGIATVRPLLKEGLLISFLRKGEAVGAIWRVSHDERHPSTRKTCAYVGGGGLSGIVILEYHATVA